MMCNDLIQGTRLSARIACLEQELQASKRKLEQIYRDCQHQWSRTEYLPEHLEAMTIPGDPAGTMGVDYRGDTHVPAKTIRKWKRVCKECGLEQITERTRMVKGPGEIPGTTGETESPIFPCS
jgi:hypothetical protein